MDPETTRTLEQDARLVIERYFLGSDRGSIREIRVLEDTVFVSAGASFEEALFEGGGVLEWSVRPMTSAMNFERSAGYALYAVSRFMSRHAREVGVAVLPDGSTFRLREELAFRAFYARVHQILAPLELAALLGFFQSKVRDGCEGLIVRREDLAEILFESDIASLTGPLLPEVTRGKQSELSLCFCTTWTRRLRIDVNRWRVYVDRRAKLMWKVESLARGLLFATGRGESARS